MFSEICQRLSNPPVSTVDVTAAIKIILVNYFSNSNNILHQSLKDRIYSSDTSTGILIEASSAFLPKLADKRPAILIKRGPWKNSQEGIYGGLDQGSVPNTYSRKIDGTHTIICIGKTPGEAEILGDEVFRLFAQVTPELLKNTCFYTFRVANLSEVKPFPEGRDHYFTAVQLVYSFTETWQIEVQPVV